MGAAIAFAVSLGFLSQVLEAISTGTTDDLTQAALVSAGAMFAAIARLNRD
jgi:hypothetical protein